MKHLYQSTHGGGLELDSCRKLAMINDDDDDAKMPAPPIKVMVVTGDDVYEILMMLLMT